MAYTLSHIHGLFDKNQDMNDSIVNEFYNFFPTQIHKKEFISK